MGDIAGDGGFAHVIGTQQDNVDGLTEEVETQEVVDHFAVTLSGPGPVEVGQGLEVAQPRALRPDPSSSRRPRATVETSSPSSSAIRTSHPRAVPGSDGGDTRDRGPGGAAGAPGVYENPLQP